MRGLVTLLARRLADIYLECQRAAEMIALESARTVPTVQQYDEIGLRAPYTVAKAYPPMGAPSPTARRSRHQALDQPRQQRS